MKVTNETNFEPFNPPQRVAIPAKQVQVPDTAGQDEVILPKTPIDSEKKSQGALQSVKNFISSIKKAFINISEYSSGAANSIVNGFVAAGTTLGVAWLVNTAKQEKGTTQIFKGIGNGIVNSVKGAGKAVASIVTNSPLKTLKNIAYAPFKAISAVKNIKSVGKIGKTVAVLTGLAAAGATLFRANLNVSEKTAQVDHRYNTGHRVVEK
ncbi:MAG: hypothetical protein PHV68_04265 [Candidatus Gastranaerophilales bacterium]|nr:hypothetical protein [Candidatus Gastranaerophilales bacterium]